MPNQERRLHALLAGTSFRPSYGGPAFSVSRLALAVAEGGVKVGLWAPDGSATVSQLVSEHPLLFPLSGSLVEIAERFGKPDIIHDSGIWMPHNHALARLARQQKIPRIVSLRGMLEPWAMKHKRWKKNLAWPAYQRRDLRMAQLLHATAEREAENARQYELGVSLLVVANGVDLPKERTKFDLKCLCQVCEDKKTALFVGRIYPVKGLPMLIEAWARVRPQGWVLQIAGPDEAGHRLEVETLVRVKALENVVSFLGPVEGRIKTDLYRSADLFVLPTHSESFGMVVAEALAHGVPVLTTKGAPWSNLETERCGWWVEPTVDSMTEGLRLATACSKLNLRAMGERGRAWVQQHFAWESVAKQIIAAYEGLLSK